MRLLPLAFLVACSGSSSTSGTTGDTDDVPLWSTQDTDTTTTTPTDVTGTTPTPTGDYFGSIPANPLPLPTFANVSNYDGSPRVPSDLAGHPTVMWFYPAAATGG